MNIYESQLMTGSFYAKKDVRKRKLAFAIEGIEKMLDVCPKSYISLSFGKQNTIQKAKTNLL
jgi:hypothetical protein